MATIVLFELKVSAGTGEAKLSRFKEAAALTREVDGCLAVHLWRNQKNSDDMVMAQHWESREKWDQYFQRRLHQDDVLDEIIEIAGGEPRLRCFDEIEE